MTVLCGACNAENRAAAKFCKGCGRKIAQAWLPQAVPLAASTGDAALVLGAAAPIPSKPTAAAKRAAAREELRPAPAPARPRIGNGRWIVGLGLGLVLLVVAVAWWGHRNQSQGIAQPVSPALDGTADRPTEVEPTIVAPAPAAAPMLSASAPLELADTPDPESMAKVTATATVGPKARKPQPKKAAPVPAPVVEAAVSAPAPAPEPVRVPTPQETCAGRNFIARAQCMAQQCARPEVASHPQCEAVRQQQRIEEEKRNPTMAG